MEKRSKITEQEFIFEKDLCFFELSNTALLQQLSVAFINYDSTFNVQNSSVYSSIGSRIQSSMYIYENTQGNMADTCLLINFNFMETGQIFII